MQWDVVVVGAGAAGLVAAERAATRGRKTLLLEKNPRPGVRAIPSLLPSASLRREKS